MLGYQCACRLTKQKFLITLGWMKTNIYELFQMYGWFEVMSSSIRTVINGHIIYIPLSNQIDMRVGELLLLLILDLLCTTCISCVVLHCHFVMVFWFIFWHQMKTFGDVFVCCEWLISFKSSFDLVSDIFLSIAKRSRHHGCGLFFTCTKGWSRISSRKY